MESILVEVRDLCIHYGKQNALNHLSFLLPKNQVIGLLGPNGSGKTTLLKAISGLITRYTGEIWVNGMQISYKTKSFVTYLGSNPYINRDLRLREAVKLYDSFFSHFSCEIAYMLLDELSLDKDVKISHLSRGMYTQVMLSMTLSNQSMLYLLDEPFGGIDIASRDRICDLILKYYPENATMLIATHEIHDMESLFDQVLFIKRGEIALQTSADILREEKGQSLAGAYKEVFKC